jgi:plastocyanin
MRNRFIALAALALAACGGGGGDASPTSPGNTGNTGGTGGTGGSSTSTSSSINVGDNTFTPSNTTVPVGTTVTFTWVGTADHNVQFGDGPTSSIQARGTYQRTFGTAGRYPYLCTLHAGMTGTVTVQ